jgi:hypothetical protein
MGNGGFYDTHPWAVNIYDGRRLVDTDFFQENQAAQLWWSRFNLFPGWSAQLMQYTGGYVWKEVRRRERKQVAHA